MLKRGVEIHTATNKGGFCRVMNTAVVTHPCRQLGRRTPHTLSPWLALCCILLVAHSVAGAATPRILMVGDSWAWFMWLNRSLQTALQEAQLGEYEEIGMFTTVPGTTAEQWTNPKMLEVIRLEVQRHPTIDIIHLSLTGNDFLRKWNPNMSAEERHALFTKIVADLETVVRFCLDIRPNLRVAIVGYDYVNKGKNGCSWQTLNEAGIELAKMEKDLALRLGDRVRYIQNYGVIQCTFGLGQEVAHASMRLPGQAPAYDPFPGGDSRYGNPEAAMMDDIHLNIEGYAAIARNCVNSVYKEWLTEKSTSLAKQDTPVAKESKAAF